MPAGDPSWVRYLHGKDPDDADESAPLRDVDTLPDISDYQPEET